MTGSGWIKFDPDPMKGGGWPDSEQHVLAVCDFGENYVSIVTGTFRRLGRGQFEFDADTEFNGELLYWQPLPDPPEDCR